MGLVQPVLLVRGPCARAGRRGDRLRGRVVVVEPGAHRTGRAGPGVGVALAERDGRAGPVGVVGHPAAVVLPVVAHTVRVDAVRPAVVRVVVAEVHPDQVADLGAQHRPWDALVGTESVGAEVGVERVLPVRRVGAEADRPERQPVGVDMMAHHGVVAGGHRVVPEGLGLDPVLAHPAAGPEGVGGERVVGLLAPDRCRGARGGRGGGRGPGGAGQRGGGAAAQQGPHHGPAAVFGPVVSLLVLGLISRHGSLSGGDVELGGDGEPAGGPGHRSADQQSRRG